MGSKLSPSTLTRDKVRQIVNAWSGKGFLRIRALGDRIMVQEIVSHSCHTLRLKSQYEERQLAPAHVAYHGGPIDDTGPPPDRWEMPVQAPKEFAQRTQTIPVPHTEHVAGCPDCGGAGTKACSHCQGWGKVDCTSCMGRGWRENTRHVTQTGPQGVSTSVQTVRENCTFCMGGKVNCTWCQGRGRQTCSSCEGQGRVKFFQELTVHFRVAAGEQVVGGGALPGPLALRGQGEVLFDHTLPRIEPGVSVAPDVDSHVAQMLEQSQHEDKPDTRLLFQYLQVERVPVHEVTYTYRGPRVRRLWIYGADEQVHAPRAPWRWGLLLTLLAGCAAGIAAVILLVTLR
jgi:hypothetical protein